MSSKSDSETKIVEPKKPLREIRDEVLGWLDLHAWRGYDPFDGLLSPFVAPWVSGFLKNFPSSKLIRLFFIQLVKRIRFNLRKIFFIPPQENPMTFAVAALASLKAAKRREAHSLNRTKTAINKVLDLANSDTGLWGYPFPWQARAFYAEKGAPNIVASALCLRAIAEVLIPVQKEAQSNVLVEHYSKALDSLIKLFYKPDDGFFSYIEGDAVLVHNANLFGVEAVCGGIRLGLKNAIDFWPQTKAALYKSLIAQSESGRWPYGALAFHSWCDNFHTAYNILSLIKVFRTLDSVAAIDQETVQTLKSNIDDAILIGLKFYRENAKQLRMYAFIGLGISILSTLLTVTKSPLSICGSKSTLFLPRSKIATSVAKRPKTLSVASILCCCLCSFFIN